VEARKRSGPVVPRCYECGKPIFSKRDLVYHRVSFDEAGLWGVRLTRDMIRRRPFHRMCWQSRRRRQKMGLLVAVGILAGLVLVPVVVNLFR